MASKPQDQQTQTAASAGATANDATLDANAAANQKFADQSRSTLFGSYNPQTNQYSGGTESQFLNPSSLNTTSLTGPYANAYNTEANTNAQAAKNAVSTSEQNQAAHGMGATPAGYNANQQREAYQDQAQNNAANYSGLFGQQHNEALNQYQNANSMLSNNSTGASSLSLQGNTNAAGNYNGLYGTASQQTPTALGTVLGTVGTLAGAAGQAFSGKVPCWCAAEVFGGWHEPRTVIVRRWLQENFAGTRLYNLYAQYGERWAAVMRRHRSVRWFFTRLFNHFLRLARKAQ